MVATSDSKNHTMCACLWQCFDLLHLIFNSNTFCYQFFLLIQFVTIKMIIVTLDVGKLEKLYLQPASQPLQLELDKPVWNHQAPLGLEDHLD